MTMPSSTRALTLLNLDLLQNTWNWRSKLFLIPMAFSNSATCRISYANNPSRFQGGIASTLSPRNLRQTLFGGYIQDDWRWKPNVTLNIGLRYEMVTVPTETQGKLAVLRNLSDATPHLGDPFFNNPTTKNFEPRIGFAWDPRRMENGRSRRFWNVRCAASALSIHFADHLGRSIFSVHLHQQPGCRLVLQQPSASAFNKLRATYIDPNPKRNYVMQYNLNVQYQLTPSLTSSSRLCRLPWDSSAISSG